MAVKSNLTENITFEEFKNEVIEDYKIAVTSRECSLLGRREVPSLEKLNLGYSVVAKNYPK